MAMMPYYLSRLPYQDSFQVLEADIQHANALATAIPRAKGGSLIQMKLVYNQLAPLFLLFLQWMDCSCAGFLYSYLNLFHILIYKVPNDGRSNMSTHGRKATIKDFYAVLLPSLQRLRGSFHKLGSCEERHSSIEGSSCGKKVIEGDGKLTNVDLQIEDECGICLEPGTKMVLPNCCHAICIKCYRKWNRKSESCPFGRGSLRRVNSEDLWVLTRDEDVVDAETQQKMSHLELGTTTLQNGTKILLHPVELRCNNRSSIEKTADNHRLPSSRRGTVINEVATAWMNSLELI